MDQLRAKTQRQRSQAARLGRLEQQVSRLQRQVKDLQDAADEDRMLHRRLAELTDIVQNSLLPGGARAEELKAPLEEYFDKP